MIYIGRTWTRTSSFRGSCGRLWQGEEDRGDSDHSELPNAAPYEKLTLLLVASLLATPISLYIEDEEEDGADSVVDSSSSPIQIGIEEVELLLSTLSLRLRPFDLTREADEIAEKGEKGETHKERAIATYRCGQGDVLRQAVRTLAGFW